MQIFEEKVEKVWILHDHSKLDSLSKDTLEEVILLYLRELFRKDKDVTRAIYAPLNWTFERDQQSNPKRVVAFDLTAEQSSTQSEMLQEEEKSSSEEKNDKENNDEIMAAKEINEVIQLAFKNKTPKDYDALLCFSQNPPAQKVGKNAYVYPSEDGYVLVQDPDHKQLFNSWQAAWLSYGLDDSAGKYNAILNDPELRDILGDHLAISIDYRKTFEAFKSRVEKIGKEV